MEKMTLRLDGLGCANCAAKIETRTKNIQGIHHVSLDYARSKLSFEYGGDDAEQAIEEIKKIVKALEPDVKVIQQDKHSGHSGEHAQSRGDHAHGGSHGHDGAHDHASGHGHDMKALIRLGFSLTLFAAGLLLQDQKILGLVLLFAAYILSGHKVLLKSFRNILRGDIFDENFLMSIATFGAIAIGEYPEAVAVMIFYEVGEYFQDLAVNRSKNAISSLLNIRPDQATVLRDGFWMPVTPESVQIDDIIMVKPGERIALDGIIVDGGSNLDVSALTGESLPQYFEKGDAVLSGSVVTSGVIKIKVTSVFSESTVARILALVENATAHKAPTENFITKFARYYTPIVVFFAAALIAVPTLIYGFEVFDEWLYRGLIFLVISCPCALVVSVPLGFFSGIGNASRNGILVKGSNYLEALSQVDTVVFDKTGTLTEGSFEVCAVHLAPTQADEYPLLKLASIAEYHSNHPVAKSILAHSRYVVNADDIISLEEMSGHGVLVNSIHGEIVAGNDKMMHAQKIEIPVITSPYTHIHVALNGDYLGTFDIRDKIKADSKATISTLIQEGYRVLMLTGDRRETAQAVANEIGITEVKSELLPADKYEVVMSLIKEGKNVAFVGDGINDAPVLAGAHVGISMGAIGSDAAIEASDVVLITDEPSKIIKAIKISKKTKQIVTQNIVFALGTKLIIMALGTVGLSSMWMAIFADVGVALIAVLNATRVLHYKA